MDLSHLPRRATFTATARVIAASEQDRFVAKASLLPLKGLLPPGVDPTEDPDLLYIAANGACVGLCNRNGHAISKATALKINRSARNKFISTDHDRKHVVGVVLSPAFTKMGTNEPLTDEEAAAMEEPFNMAILGALWRVVDPQLTKYVSNTADAPSDELSLSWEVAYRDFSLGVGSHNLFDAKVIKAGDPTFAVYEKMLFENGGTGKDEAGQPVFMIIEDSEEFTPVILGYSAVAKPAAHVHGILPLEKTAEPTVAPANELSTEQSASLENQPESGPGYHLVDLVMQDGSTIENVAVLNRRTVPAGIAAAEVVAVTPCKKIAEKSVNPEKPSVTPVIIQAMTIKTIADVEAQWGELTKMSAASAREMIQQVIVEEGAKYVAKVEAQENATKLAEEAKAEALKLAAESATAVANLQKQLDEVRAAASAAEAAQKFQDRMNGFAEEYDLDADERKIVASDIKDLSDEQFTAYAEKCKVLFKGKKKGQKPEKGGNTADDDMKASKSSVAPAKEALASVVPVGDPAPLLGEADVNVSLAQQIANAFGASMKIDGKPVVAPAK